MKRKGWRRPFRHMGRYHEILRVLVKYGFWSIVERIQVGLISDVTKRLLPRMEKKEYASLGTPVRLRLAFEELGPTFIKLGQLLSVRPDLIPPEIADEFSKLQDEIEPVNYDIIRTVIKTEYEVPVREKFQRIEKQALAAASIAQVHRAKLKDSTPVALKILRPDIHPVIETDLEILYHLAELAEKYIPESRNFDPTGIVREFTRTIRKEQNLALEGRYIDIFRRYLKEDSTVKIPYVYWDYTTEKLLVTELIEGIKISNIEALDEAGLDRNILAENGANLLLKQIFEIGIFHADPHPGNIFAIEGNVIAPVDFGMIGRIDQDTREALADILRNIVDRDAYRIARVLLNIGMVGEKVNIKQLERDISEHLDRYYGVPLKQVDANRLINEFMHLVREHNIQLPSDLVMMGKVLVLSESIGRKLNPEFNLFELIIPFTRKIYFQRFSPFYQYRNFSRMFDESISLLKNLPDDLRTILSKIKQDKVSINFHHRGLEYLTRELDRSSNRISFALIIAAIIIASSLIIMFDKGPFLLGYPALGIIGYVLASILGFWLIIAILRSGKL